MSDEESVNNDFVDDPEETPPEPEPVKKGKKGMRKSVPATPERLEILARAREKALEVRKANAEARGKGKIREEAKQKAEANKKEAEDKFNKKVDEEVQKRMKELNLEKTDQPEKTPRKPRKKKVVYEESSSESEEEIIVRKRRPRKTIIQKVVEQPAPAPAPPPAPEPTPEPPPVQRQQEINPYQNLLRTIPQAGLRSSRNPFYRPIR